MKGTIKNWLLLILEFNNVKQGKWHHREWQRGTLANVGTYADDVIEHKSGVHVLLEHAQLI